MRTTIKKSAKNAYEVWLDRSGAKETVSMFNDVKAARAFAHAENKRLSENDPVGWYVVEDYTYLQPYIVTYREGIAGIAWASGIDADGQPLGWFWEPLN